MNANEEMLAGYADPDAVILILILMLLNLNTGYADTDADLCIRIMSLCCKRSCMLISILLINVSDKLMYHAFFQTKI